MAVTFVADTAGAAGPWPQVFEAWADERELSPELRRLTRVAIIRTRCFGGLSVRILGTLALPHSETRSRLSGRKDGT